jgi:phosphoribosylanthranilate isomerase
MLAMRCGASFLGLVSQMPSGPGPISEEKITKIATAVPPSVTTVLLTSLTDAEKIISQQEKCKTNAIQLVDHVEYDELEKIKNGLPEIGLIQVVHVTDEKAIARAKLVEHFVDAILLDSGNPHQKVKELGGTGRVHNWKISKQICKNSAKPIFLAGGLRPENVPKAIEIVKPFAVDVCSGVRRNGKLDEKTLKNFFHAIKKSSDHLDEI